MAAWSAELPTRMPESLVARPTERSLETPKERADDVRKDALARAAVWSTPAQPPSAADLGSNPDPFPDPAVCRFQPSEPSGATPKFDCVFEGGEVLKVKYGTNPEVHTEAAATRLLAALGFGADRIYLVKKLRCFGCPMDPYSFTKTTGIDTTRFMDFQNVAIERRPPGKAIAGKSDQEGWGWDELDDAQGTGRGATKAERDALRLMAVLLNNWDNRPDNQRLLCLPEGYPAQPSGHCGKALAYMHDVGGTFGRVRGTLSRIRGKGSEERKLDVEAWSRVPVWKDRATCTVGIKSPRLHGATFGEAKIGEPGRQLLAGLLGQLSRAQMDALFAGALVDEYEDAKPPSADVARWSAALQDKVRQITEGAPCPAL
jgi:hypothetical protein